MSMEKYIPAHTLVNTPLAGCYEMVRMEPGNFDTLRQALTFRLQLYYSKEGVFLFRMRIGVEANRARFAVHLYEYVINELQYELRLAQSIGSPESELEKRLVDEWVQKVIAERGEDIALDFFNQLKKNREERAVMRAAPN